MLSPALLWLYPLLPQLYLRYGTHVSDVRQRVDEEKMRENTGPPCVLVPNRYADDCDRQPGGEKKGESFRRHLGRMFRVYVSPTGVPGKIYEFNEINLDLTVESDPMQPIPHVLTERYFA